MYHKAWLITDKAHRWHSSLLCAFWTMALVSAVHGFHINAVSVMFIASLLGSNITGHVVDAILSEHPVHTHNR